MKYADDARQTPVQLDFSSSGGTTEPATAFHVDGQTLVNAAEFIDWTEDPVQLHVCEQCGTPRCKPGATVAVRRADDFAVLMPAFEAMSDGERERREYRPPELLNRDGVLALNPTVYDRLQSPSPDARPLEDLEPLRASETLRILQFEAPFELLGAFPDDIHLRADELIGADPVELTEAIHLLDSTIDRWRESTRPVSFRRRTDDDQLVSLFVDGPSFIEWKPLVARDAAPGLHFDAGFVAGDRT